MAAASLCGTDREVYEWTPSAQAFDLSLPVVTGHEGAGTIVEVGPGVTGLRVGDRVALESHLICGQCLRLPHRQRPHLRTHRHHRHAHRRGVRRTRRRPRGRSACRLPDALPLEVGALLESAGVAVHAIQRSGTGVAGQNVLVNGCGPVGLALIQIAVAMGAANVVAVEPNPFRRTHAENIGARRAGTQRSGGRRLP